MKNEKDRVTIYQVAHLAGVSLATVSRVINHRGNVTPDTEEKVQAAIKSLNYRPSGLAQALATSKSTNIGVVIPSANYVYLSNMLNGISEVARDKGFIISLFTTSHSDKEAHEAIEKVIRSHVDGAIIFNDELNNEKGAELISSDHYNVPVIAIDHVITSERAGYITLGYSELLRDVIKSYYKNGGDKQMYFVRVYDGGQLLKKCESVFNSTLTELGKKHYLLDSDDSYTRTYGDFINIFKKQKNGYFIAYRDSIAAAILNAATDSGLKVPDDIEILSLVGTKYANIVRPTLTSMQISMSEVGKRAMYMLIDLINGSQGPKSYLFSPVLTPKSSTKFN